MVSRLAVDQPRASAAVWAVNAVRDRSPHEGFQKRAAKLVAGCSTWHTRKGLGKGGGFFECTVNAREVAGTG